MTGLCLPRTTLMTSKLCMQLVIVHSNDHVWAINKHAALGVYSMLTAETLLLTMLITQLCWN